MTTFIDLFAGVGGFRLALNNLGCKCLFSSEIDKNAQITYALNFGETPFGDITEKSIKDKIPKEFDILCGGFPCQSFSIAGLKKGFDDVRGTLFFDIVEIIKNHNPKVVFLENVKNLISHDKGSTFKVILEYLENLGYKVFYQVLNTSNHANIPQNRERVFIVAFNTNTVSNYDKFTFPEKIPLTNTIHNFIDSDKQDDIYYYKDGSLYYNMLVESVVSFNTVYQYRRTYIRENKSNLCPTLTANMGTGGHNVPIIRDKFGIRKLTPKECFKFQGYPMDTFFLPKIANSKLYLQAGNSVTTSLVQRISKNIIDIL